MGFFVDWPIAIGFYKMLGYLVTGMEFVEW